MATVSVFFAVGGRAAELRPPPAIGPLVAPVDLSVPNAPPAAIEAVFRSSPLLVVTAPALRGSVLGILAAAAAPAAELEAAAALEEDGGAEVAAGAPASDQAASSEEPMAPRGWPVPSRGPFYDPPNDEERTLVEYAMYHCDNASARFAKPFWMLELLRVEHDFGVPPELRGITLATWCGEAAYQMHDVVGDEGAAVGILQLHPELTRLCGAPALRHDPIASAQCWLWNLNRIHAKAARRCRKSRAWKAAELWLSQGGRKSGYSCKHVSGHVARLERWQRDLSASAQRRAR